MKWHLYSQEQPIAEGNIPITCDEVAVEVLKAAGIERMMECQAEGKPPYKMDVDLSRMPPQSDVVIEMAAGDSENMLPFLLHVFRERTPEIVDHLETMGEPEQAAHRRELAETAEDVDQYIASTYRWYELFGQS